MRDQVAAAPPEARLVDEHREHPARARRIRWLGHRRQPRHAIERRAITRGNGTLRLQVDIETLGLSTAEGCLNRGEPVIEPDLAVHELDWVVLRLGRQVTRAVRPVLTVRDDHPAATRGDQFVAVEAETADVAEP